MDPRRFKDTYDRYDTTVSTAPGGVDQIVEPNTPTETGLPCLFLDGPASPFTVGAAGLEQGFDATLVIPATQTLRPEKESDQPDHVKVDSRMFVVEAVHDARGRGKFKVARLTERGGG